MLTAALLIADTLANLMGPGVSLELARLRAETLRDVRYRLELDLTARDSAVGEIEIRVRRTAGAGDLVLDFRGRRLGAVAANGRSLESAEWNGAHLRVPETSLRAGENVVSARFVSEIAQSGASIIRFHDAAAEADFLYTLLVPADANQLFPSFDQPDLKARVSLSLRTPRGWTALSNSSVREVDSTREALTYRFTETRPLSTYLIAFAAGPWQRVTGSYGGRSITAYVRPSRAAEADLDSLIHANGRALEWMEGYFGRPYPYEKYDFLLAPAFPFGGMEHPGAVFYSENAFIFRERPTLPRRLGRFATILHEVAHQWFGDLVTMRWFDDLWLKEGFATYMASKALADLEPESDAWKTFHLRNKPAAYGVDQTAGTTPVWQELANLDQAKSNYGPIVYNKAPSVLKQLEYRVGEPEFRTGVRDFLRRHAYANATWRDLLTAIGGAAGIDLGSWGEQYILRPGMPEIEPVVEVKDGRLASLRLRQRPVLEMSGTGAWPIRTELLLGFPDRPDLELPVLLEGDSTRVDLPANLPAPWLVFANAGDHAYALTRLDDASIARLTETGLGGVEDPLLRALLWSALWDEVRAARMSPVSFVELALRELPRERDEQLVPSLLGRVDRAVSAYLSEADRRRLLASIERMLIAGASDAALGYGIRTAKLDALVGLAATPGGVAELRRLLAADSAAGEPVRDPTRWEIVTRLLALDQPDAERLLAAQAARDTTPDGRRRAFVAGAARPTAEVKRGYFERYFADRGLNEEWASASLSAFNEIGHQALTLGWLRPALDSLGYIQRHRRIFFLGSWLGAFLSGRTDPDGLLVVRGFLADHPDLPADLRRKVLQYADELERTVRIRARWSGGRAISLSDPAGP
ncbi:MAG: M1 family metallopeptidase [Gemmatimonadales bacterium]